MPFFQKNKPIIIRPYGGFANDTHFFAKARVLEDRKVEHLESDGALRTMMNFYKRMGSEEKAGIEVLIRWKGKEEKIVSDREGYVNIRLPHQLESNSESNEWLEIELELKQEGYTASSQILRPGKAVGMALISDIDDTVIQTGVASRMKWRMMVNSTFKNPFIRKPLQGVSEFYQALHKGKPGSSDIPVFYVSNSPWNLFGYLETFLRHHGFPQGPLILRDIGVDPIEHTKLGGKYGRVKQIVTAFPNMKFILSGDSAEVDTDIYLRLAKEHPDQIQSIFIRAVKNRNRMKRVQKLIESHADINVRLIRHSAEGMAFAKELDLI